MSFQIQITVDSIAEAERILACLRHDNPPAAQVKFDDPAGLSDAESPAAKYFPGATNIAEPKKRGRPRKEESAAPAATESAASEPQGEPSGTADPAQQTPPTFDDAKAALQALLARHDGDMTVPLQVLAEYDAQRISAVKEADWPAFIAACKAA